MFGGFLKKLKGAYTDLATSSVKAENKDLMEAMVASAALVAYADGELSSAEADMTRKIISTSSQLSVFGTTPVSVFDKYCDKMEASGRMGKLDLLKEIKEVATSSEDAARVLIMAIEVADSDSGIGEKETAVLNSIAAALNLRLSDFL